MATRVHAMTNTHGRNLSLGRVATKCAVVGVCFGCGTCIGTRIMACVGEIVSETAWPTWRDWLVQFWMARFAS